MRHRRPVRTSAMIAATASEDRSCSSTGRGRAAASPRLPPATPRRSSRRRPIAERCYRTPSRSPGGVSGLRRPLPARQCHDPPMAASSAELSSLATALDELTRRVTAHADAATVGQGRGDGQGAVRRRARPRQCEPPAGPPGRVPGAPLVPTGRTHPNRRGPRPRVPPGAAKAPRRVPSRERVGRRIPNTALRNQLAGTGSEASYDHHVFGRTFPVEGQLEPSRISLGSTLPCPESLTNQRFSSKMSVVATIDDHPDRVGAEVGELAVRASR